ncbi:solute carrier family 22 member 7-like [Ornithodoros turicata]|uniref:solute carrier family 22 member 7-like n=1 Tax=Ornithodoros turicata TaxID=34597 RepID=UPI003139E06A
MASDGLRELSRKLSRRSRSEDKISEKMPRKSEPEGRPRRRSSCSSHPATNPSEISMQRQPARTQQRTIVNFGNPVVLQECTRGDRATQRPIPSPDSDTELQYSYGNIYGHGCFQQQVLFYTILSMLVMQCHNLAFTQIAQPVEYWCKRPANFDNISLEAWKKLGTPIDADGSHSRCEQYDSVYASDRAVVPCKAWEFESNSTTIIAQWNLVCNREWMLSLAAAMYMAGAMIAVPISGVWADQVGRKPVMRGAALVMTFSGFCCCFVTSFILFVCARCVVSACVSIIFVLSSIVSLEVTSYEHRAYYGTITSSVGVIVAKVLFFVMEHFNIEWRAVLMIFMVFTMALFIAIFQLKESPRWLMATFDFKRAEQIVLWAAKLNNEPLDTVRRGYGELKGNLTKQCESVISLKPPHTLLFASPEIRTRCGILGVCSFTLMFTYYGLSYTHHIQVQEWAQVVFSISFGPLAAVAYVAMNKFGRKRTLAASLFVLATSSVALTATTHMYSVLLDNVVLLITSAATLVAYIVHFVYTTELFPTVLRCVAVCGVYTCGRIGATVAAAITSSMVLTDPKATFALISVLALACEYVISKLPETQSMHLANTVKEAEIGKQTRRGSENDERAPISEDAVKDGQETIQSQASTFPVMTPPPPSETTFVRRYLE